jgi:hypothetical protein
MARGLWIIHKEGLCPSSGDINRLMMMSYIQKFYIYDIIVDDSGIPGIFGMWCDVHNRHFYVSTRALDT